MKVKVDVKRTIRLFIITDLIFAALLFLSCINLFSKFGAVQILVILVFVAVSILMLVLSLKRNFYVIENKYIVVVRSFKNMYYNYSDVVYIDKEQSERRKILCFATSRGDARYLPFDAKGEIYKTMLKRCNNLLSEEEFKRRYPNVKL